MLVESALDSLTIIAGCKSSPLVSDTKRKDKKNEYERRR